jgi:hypothetical protein
LPAGGKRWPNRYGLPWIRIEGRPGGRNGGPPPKGYLEIKSPEEAKRRLEGLKEKRKDPQARKVRVIVEFEDV